MSKKVMRLMVSVGIVLGLLLGMNLEGQSVIALGCPTVRQGSPRSECVRQLQWKLGSLGYMDSTLQTGHFGSITDGAVREFQRWSGLADDGIVGPLTWGRLDTTTLDSMSPYGIPQTCFRPGFMICAGKRAQRLWVMRDGQIVLSLDARFGDDLGPEHATVEGRYPIYRRIKDEVSWQYNNAPMPYTEYFYKGQGIHFSPPFAAGINGNVSHGCIRLRDENAAAAIFYYVPDGTPVFIWK